MLKNKDGKMEIKHKNPIMYLFSIFFMQLVFLAIANLFLATIHSHIFPFPLPVPPVRVPYLTPILTPISFPFMFENNLLSASLKFTI